MIGILFATRQEAAPFLRLSAPRATVSRPFKTFQTNGCGPTPCTVIISGMGKIAAAAATSHLVLVHKVSILINAGLCGRLVDHGRWSVGDCFRIEAAIEGDCDHFSQPETVVSCESRWFHHLPDARLVTCDRPVFDAHRRLRLSQSGDLADMEGAAIARVAALYGIPCAMVKGISDAADENGRQTLARHIDRVAARIADVLVAELAQPTDK